MQREGTLRGRMGKIKGEMMYKKDGKARYITEGVNVKMWTGGKGRKNRIIIHKRKKKTD